MSVSSICIIFVSIQPMTRSSEEIFTENVKQFEIDLKRDGRASFPGLFTFEEYIETKEKIWEHLSKVSYYDPIDERFYKNRPLPQYERLSAYPKHISET